MRALRVGALAILILGLAGGAVVWFSWHNQQKLVGLVLGMIREQTGFAIVPERSWLSFDTHLVVVLERPTISLNGRRLATLKQVRAEISYQKLLGSYGLPLYSLELVEARAVIPPSSSASLPSLAGLLGLLGPGAASSLQKEAARFGRVTQQLWIEDAEVADSAGPFLQKIHLSVQQSGFFSHQLVARASAEVRLPPRSWVPLFVQAKLRLRRPLSAAPPFSMNAQLSQVPLRLVGRNLAFKGLAKASAGCQLAADGALSARSNTSLSRVEIERAGGPRPAVLPGTWDLNTRVAASPQQVELQSAELSLDGTQYVTANGSLSRPFDASAALKLEASTAPVALLALRNVASELGLLNAAQAKMLERVRSGTVSIHGAVLDTDLSGLLSRPVSVLRRGLRLEGEFKSVGFSLPPPWASGQAKVTDVAATLEGESLRLRQGSAEFAGAKVERLTATFDLSQLPNAVSYKLSAAGVVDVGKFYSVAVPSLPKPMVARLDGLGGYSRFDLNASGMFSSSGWQAPRDYLVVLAPRNVEVDAKGAPRPLLFTSGTLAVDARGFKFDSLVTEVASKDGVADPDAGSAVVRGSVEPERSGLRFNKLAVDVHQVSAARWLPLVVSPEDLSIDGSVGGTVQLNGTAAPASKLQVSGHLTLGRAQIKAAFLRVPLAVDSVSIVVSGRHARASIPAANLNGDPLRLYLAINDLRHPALRIDGDAQRLDLTSFKFFRAPWTPATPSRPVPIPIYGHARVQTALVGTLILDRASADYRYDHGDWNISNLTAGAAGGHLEVNIRGRQRDDWIHIQGQGSGLRAGTLFLMSSGPESQPPLVGTLDAAANVWADTDADFFQTLAGKVAAVLKNGRLNRLTVLSQILSLIDLKTWLSARVPDPRVHGLPFDTLSGTAAGSGGNFHTDNTRLQGPVMHLSAEGDISPGAQTMNLDVEAVPFNGVSWLVSLIPLVGENVSAGSRNLFAAYLKVRGPLSNPSVTPMPITSVAKFVTKVIALPINIISPDTVR